MSKERKDLDAVKYRGMTIETWMAYLSVDGTGVYATSIDGEMLPTLSLKEHILDWAKKAIDDYCYVRLGVLPPAMKVIRSSNRSHV